MIGDLLELAQIWRTRKLDPERLREVQARKLRETIAHACEYVPYYRELFRSSGIRPADIRTVEDLRHVPITTKEQLRDAGDEATLARGADLRNCVRPSTSGSTGRPFTVTMSRSDLRRRRLVEFRALFAAGFRARDRLVVLGPITARPPRLQDRMGIYGTHVVVGTLRPEEQLRRLEKLAPDVLWFYPTSLRAVLQAAGGAIPKVRPRLLISSSEVLPGNLERQLCEQFGSSPMQFYGSIETGRIAAECPARRGLHMQADSVVLESWAGDRPSAMGEPGSAVVTTLWSRTMPFIRYRLFDLVELAPEETCSCGSPFPMMRRPLGRYNDMALLPGGRMLASFVLGHALRKNPDIDQFRITQEALDRFTVVLASRRPWPADEIEDVRRAIREALRENAEVDVRVVESLPQEPGKFRDFVSKITPT